ncbi:helix-turn-helix domain-containing protein [Elioraea sp.]|uniref:helix-turn-helix domain-containing protein n=1 Tax=Elioraea sp. TaxID=2185103 RepID=UPI0025C063AF|nr:helix-turn-helix domain-containing protein [Elioraea sp.]
MKRSRSAILNGPGRVAACALFLSIPPAAEGFGGCVRRAMLAASAVLERDPAAIPSLAELAAAAGVSPRTLQRAFAHVLGLSPGAALRQLRLAAARQTLRNGAARSVVAAAQHHGFEHPGRFAISYARTFGEAPSATLRAARGGGLPAVAPPHRAPVMLRALMPDSAADRAGARRATEDLQIAIGRAPGLALLDPESATGSPWGLLRLDGSVAAGSVVISVVRPASGTVLGTIREPLRRRAGIAWADRAIGTMRALVAAEQAERARRTPPRRADVEALVARALPAALSQEPDLVGVALELVSEALERDPAHPRALALAGWARAIGANHAFTLDPEGERGRARDECGRALALAPDDPEVLTLSAGILSLTGSLDAAEGLVKRSLGIDPCQPEALRRLGFICNFRGDGRRGAEAFRRAFRLFPGGGDGAMSLIGLGVAHFIQGDYGRAARSLASALERQPARAWPHRFLAAAAMHLGAEQEARRSLTALRRAFPDLTVELCARSGVLHPEAKARMLDGLIRSGLPR